MNSLPQIQSVSNCRSVSDKEASHMLTKFLLSYKKFGETGVVANTDDAPTDEYIDKLLGMEEDQSGSGTHEEIQARLEGIIRSLNGIKKPMTKTEPAVAKEPSSNEEESAASPIKVKNESIEAKTPSETKEEKKLRKKQEKEAKKSAKKAKKEAKEKEEGRRKGKLKIQKDKD